MYIYSYTHAHTHIASYIVTIQMGTSCCVAKIPFLPDVMVASLLHGQVGGYPPNIACLCRSYVSTCLPCNIIPVAIATQLIRLPR